MKKLFAIKKLIYANSVQDALKNEQHATIIEVFVEPKFLEINLKETDLPATKE